MRAKLKRIVTRVGERLAEDGFWILDGKGNKTRPTLLYRLAWTRLMLTVNPEAFSADELEYARYNETLLRFGVKFRDVWFSEYFPNNLTMIGLFTLCMLEDGPDLRKEYRRVMREGYTEGLAHHLNAHFAALYLLCTGAEDQSAVASVHGQLLAFPEEKWARPRDLREREDVDMLNEDYARHAFLAHEAMPGDFLWQRAPALAHSATDAALEYPGLDMFLPYWTARAAGVLEAP